LLAGVVASAGLVLRVRAHPEPGVCVRRYLCVQEQIQGCQILFGTLGILGRFGAGFCTELVRGGFVNLLSQFEQVELQGWALGRFKLAK
jgi:hypothetical protein